MDTDSFAWYITEQLAPTLRPGQVVVVDNLSAHKADRIRQAIAARGCELLFLPPYSPDYTPIDTRGPALTPCSKLLDYRRELLARLRSGPGVAVHAVLRPDVLDQPDEREVPADANRTRTELVPAVVIDAGDVLEPQAGPAGA